MAFNVVEFGCFALISKGMPPWLITAFANILIACDGLKPTSSQI
jgi:hypothetical protein